MSLIHNIFGKCIFLKHIDTIFIYKRNIFIFWYFLIIFFPNWIINKDVTSIFYNRGWGKGYVMYMHIWNLYQAIKLGCNKGMGEIYSRKIWIVLRLGFKM